MSNTLLTPSIIAKEALAQLYAQTVMANLVHRDFSNEFVAKVGDTITVRKPATFTAQEFTSTISVQNATESSVAVKMDKHLDVSFEVTSQEMTLKVEDFSKQFLVPAMKAFAQKIDGYLLALYKNIPYKAAITGTPAFKDLAGPMKILNDNKVPMADRRLVMGSKAHADFVVMDNFVNAEKAGTTEALRNASMGRVLGFDTFMDQNVYAHTKGTLAPASGGTIMNKTEITAASALTTAVFKSSTLTGTLKEGDIFTVAGDSATHVVTALATASGNEISVNFYPANQATWAADAEVTVLSLSASDQNIAFHKDAFALVTRPLVLPMGAANAAIVQYDGFGLRVVYGYDQTYKKDVVSIDMLCGVKTLTPEMACRLYY